MRRIAYLPLLLGIALILLAGLVRPAEAAGWTPADVHAAIAIAAEEYGVSYRLLDRIVSCETGETYDPYAVGDHGTSFGAIQLHDGGLLNHYHRVTGGASAYNPYRALEYLARVARGDWRGQGVTLDHWSCF